MNLVVFLIICLGIAGTVVFFIFRKMKIVGEDDVVEKNEKLMLNIMTKLSCNFSDSSDTDILKIKAVNHIIEARLMHDKYASKKDISESDLEYLYIILSALDNFLEIYISGIDIRLAEYFKLVNQYFDLAVEVFIKTSNVLTPDMYLDIMNEVLEDDPNVYEKILYLRVFANSDYSAEEKNKYFNKIKNGNDLDLKIETCRYTEEDGKAFLLDVFKRKNLEEHQRENALENLIFLYTNNNDKELLKKIIPLIKSSSFKIQIRAGIMLKDEGVQLMIETLGDYKKIEYHEIINLLEFLVEKKASVSLSLLKAVFDFDTKEFAQSKIINLLCFCEDNKTEDFVIKYIEENKLSIDYDVLEFFALKGTHRALKLLNMHLNEVDDSYLRKEYLKTIAKITERHGDVEKGWVSVPEQQDLDGALSKDASPGKGSLSKGKM